LIPQKTSSGVCRIQGFEPRFRDWTPKLTYEVNYNILFKSKSRPQNGWCNLAHMRKGQKVKKISLDSIDKNIISELIKDADIGTSHLSRKFKVPLSTMQRRKRTLENS